MDATPSHVKESNKSHFVIYIKLKKKHSQFITVIKKKIDMQGLFVIGGLVVVKKLTYPTSSSIC